MNALGNSIRIIGSLSILVALSGVLSACQASNDRFATETAASRETVQMTPTNTPSGDLLVIDGNPVHHVYISSTDGPPQYALTDEWLYRWDGNEWVHTTTRGDDRAILVDPERPERLFRGDHPVCSEEEVETEPITFSKSTDGGNTWRAIPGGDNIRPLAIDPTLGDVIYGSDCGLAISADAGETWRAYYLAHGYTVVDAVVVGERLLVLELSLTGGGRVRSINVTVPEDPELVNVLFETGNAFALDARGERIVVGGMEGVSFSLDSGETWTTSRSGLEEVTVESIRDLPPREGRDAQPEFGVLAVQIDPLNTERIFAGTVRGLYISQDAGLTWDEYTRVRHDVQVLNIQFAAGGNDIFITTPDGVLSVPNP